MPLYTRKNEGRYLIPVDPRTGDTIFAAWADTEWALLKGMDCEDS